MSSYSIFVNVIFFYLISSSELRLDIFFLDFCKIFTVNDHFDVFHDTLGHIIRLISKYKRSQKISIPWFVK